MYALYFMRSKRLGREGDGTTAKRWPWIYIIKFFTPCVLNIYCEKTDFVPERNRKSRGPTGTHFASR